MLQPRRLLVIFALLLLVLPVGSATALAQGIIITSPAPETVVGSPVVITGLVSTTPANNSLFYRVFNVETFNLGSGSIEVFGSPGQPGSFNASISFSLPPSGGPIRIEVYDLDRQGQVVTSGWVDLRVAESPVEQSITIDSPSPYTLIGSPVTLVGRTTRYPNRGRLGYSVLGPGNTNLGSGDFPVLGAPGEPATFNVSLPFQLPSGGVVRFVIYDQDPRTGVYAGYSAIDLTVGAPPPPPAPVPTQQIVIDSPAPGATVGSPMTVLGRTAVIPSRGFLEFRITDAAITVELGSGVLAVRPAGDQGSVFNASVEYAVPPQGGPIRLEVYDRDVSGALAAQANITLVVAPSTPPPPPTPVRQQIFFDAPPPGTVVGSPVGIAGRTALFPSFGVLNYRFFDAGNIQLGSGTFGVVPDGAGAAFNVSLTFDLPADGGPVRLELLDINATGNILARSSLNLLVTPPEQQQQLFIDTPAPETTVGSPVVITGRTARFPDRGVLFYRFTDPNNNDLGNGSFPVAGAPGQPATFVASLGFNLPPGGGFIRLEVYDLNNANAVVATTTLTLRVDEPPEDTLRRFLWRLEYIGRSGRPDGALGRVTITFDNSGNVRGDTGCGTYRADYEASGEYMRIRNLRGDRRGCDDERADQTDRYYDALNRADRFGIRNDNRLYIYYNGVSDVLEYRIE